MAYALQRNDSPTRAKVVKHGKRTVYARWPGIVELKRRALVARLQRKATLADDPANWITLTGLSDDEAIAVLRRR